MATVLSPTCRTRQRAANSYTGAKLRASTSRFCRLNEQIVS
jgi:hypothetical protein